MNAGQIGYNFDNTVRKGRLKCCRTLRALLGSMNGVEKLLDFALSV